MADNTEFVKVKRHVAITKSILEYLNTLAIKNGYNRQLAEWIFSATPMGELDCIDARFPVFLKLSMPHYHKEGVRTDMHYRTIWEVVMMGTTDDSTTTVIVDIPQEAFDMLPEVPTVTSIDDDVVEVWDNIATEEMTNNFIQDVEKLLQNEEEE